MSGSAKPRRATGVPSSSSAIKVVSAFRVSPSPVVLCSGPEDFLADRAFTHLRTVLRAKDPDTMVVELDAADYVPGGLFDAVSPSLFGEYRLVRIENAEKCSDEFLEDVLAYLPHCADDVTIVIRHRSGVRGKRMLELVRSGDVPAIEVSCAELKSDKEKIDFAAEEFVRADRITTPAGIRALVNAFSSSVAELASACAQLIADTTGEITEQTVATYYGGRIEATAFAVADAAIAGNYALAMATLRHALDTGADPVPLVAAFASKLRLMAKVAGDRRSSNELASVVGGAPWQIDRARRDLSNWSERGLSNAILAVADADSGVKGASRDPVFAVEKMVTIVARFGIVAEHGHGASHR